MCWFVYKYTLWWVMELFSKTSVITWIIHMFVHWVITIGKSKMIIDKWLNIVTRYLFECSVVKMILKWELIPAFVILMCLSGNGQEDNVFGSPVFSNPGRRPIIPGLGNHGPYFPPAFHQPRPPNSNPPYQVSVVFIFIRDVFSYHLCGTLSYKADDPGSSCSFFLNLYSLS